VYKAGAEIRYDVGGPQNITLTYMPAYIDYGFKFTIPIAASAYFPNPGVPAILWRVLCHARTCMTPQDRLPTQCRINAESRAQVDLWATYQLISMCPPRALLRLMSPIHGVFRRSCATLCICDRGRSVVRHRYKSCPMPICEVTYSS